MGLAIFGADLDTWGPFAKVVVGFNVFVDERSDEAWPTGSRIKLVERGEEGFSGHDIDVDSFFVMIPKSVGESGFGIGTLGNAVLEFGQLFLEDGGFGFDEFLPRTFPRSF